MAARSIAAVMPRMLTDDERPAELVAIPLRLDGVLRKRAARLDYRVRPFRGVDVSVGVHRHAFARRALIHAVVTVERRDEPGHAVLADRPDPDAVAPVRVVVRTRLRVVHIHSVALDEQAARAAGRVGRLEVSSGLIDALG